MNESPSTVDDSLPQSVLEQADRICDRFEDAWLAGRRPRIEDYLGDVPEGRQRDDLLEKLIAVDIFHRRKRGETPGPGDYRGRFPSLPASWLAAAAGTPTLSPGRYRLGDKIGHGGMGDVLRGRDLHLSRDLAVKVLREEHQGQTHLHRRFLEEARIGGRLQHPGIVPVYDLDELSDRRPFFTMKLVQGRTLAALLAERAEPTKDLPRFLSVFEQICQTLAYAHAQGVIHRDLKPANVMVGAFGEVQVMDWGLAKVLKPGRAAEAAVGREGEAAGPALEDTAWEMRTRTGQAMGTLSYIPPEQARGEVDRVDERSDVFGLGAILCEILTGRPPFTGTGGNDIFAKAKACNHGEALARLDACGAEAELVALAKACLAAEAADRPANAGAVAEGMKAYLAGVQERLRAAERERAAAQARAEESRKTAAAEQARAEEARRTAAAEQARAEEAQKKVAAERRARRRTVWLATAVLLLGFLGGGGGLWWTWQRAELVRSGDADLAEVRDNLENWKIRDAQKAMERAEGRVAGGGPADLLRRVQQMRDDLTLVKRLDKIRLKKATVAEGYLDYAAADRDYATLFAEVGLAREGEDTAVVAARIRDSAIKAQLAAALDDWAIATANPARRAWMLEVARRAEPGEWSDRFRDPAVWGKPAALEQLAKEANVAELSPQLLTALGEALMSTKANAGPLLRAAQARHPDDFWLNFQLGNALYELKPDEAVGYYRAALAVQPETSAVYYNLGNALADKGRLDEAIQAYRRAIELDPKDAKAHFNLGLALAARGRLDEAIQEYRRAIALDPKYAKAHNNLGTALQSKGRLDEAIQEYRRAIALDPKYADAHNNLGAALEAKGRTDEAIQEYRWAIELDPKEAKAHNNLGLALKAKGRLDEAIQEYQRAIELDPKDANAHNNLGAALAAKGQLDAAIQEFQRAIALDPKLALPHLNLGIALKDKGRLDEAIQEYRRAIALDPKYADAHNNLGLALADKGRTDEAIQAYRRAIELDPKDAKAHFNLGLALAARGRLDEAIQEYRRAIALDPKLAQPHLNLGIALVAKGRMDAAIQEFQRAIELDPKHAKVYGALGEALLQQGRFAKAREATRRCLELLPAEDPLRQPVAQLLQQCEQLLALDAKLPAILKGEAKPTDSAERIGFALMCQQYKHLYAASARFYAEAFADQPRLAEDLDEGHRYNAARAAALAGSGKGKDAGRLPDKEYARLRRQALDWLRADLTAWTKVIDKGLPEARQAAAQTLQQWQKDPDLAGLRDKGAVDKLPQAERDACRKLWADVAALLQRAQEK